MRERWRRTKERMAVARLPRDERRAAKAEREAEARMRAERNPPFDHRLAQRLAAEAAAPADLSERAGSRTSGQFVNLRGPGAVCRHDPDPIPLRAAGRDRA